jgi:hypothetical protein
MDAVNFIIDANWTLSRQSNGQFVPVSTAIMTTSIHDAKGAGSILRFASVGRHSSATVKIGFYMIQIQQIGIMWTHYEELFRMVSAQLLATNYPLSLRCTA